MMPFGNGQVAPRSRGYNPMNADKTFSACLLTAFPLKWRAWGGTQRSHFDSTPFVSEFVHLWTL